MAESGKGNNETRCYIVYWYPTIFHKERKRRHKYNKELVEISDKSRHILKIKKEELSNLDLQYFVQFNNATGKSFSFKYIE